MDSYTKLLSLIDAPSDTDVEELARMILDENDANVSLAGECNRLINWLSYIIRHSRGKAREWATIAVDSEDKPDEQP